MPLTRAPLLLLAALTALPAMAAPLFENVTAASGIPSIKYGEGVTVFDADGDGRSDLFLPCTRGANRLFRNLGGLVFEDATQPLGLASTDGVGAVAADFGGGPAPDLFVVRGMDTSAENLLFMDGDSDGITRYQEVGAAAGVARRGNGKIAAAAGDIELDGRIDLLVSTWSGTIAYRNLAPGFEQLDDIGLAGEGKGWGGLLFDLTNDGLPDFFVARGTRGRPDPSRFFINRGGGRFEDVTETSGIRGITWGMGAVPADFDNDGDFDLLVTNFDGRDRLFRNDGEGRFTDVTKDSGLTSGKSVGATAGDVDGDLLPDLVVAGFGEPLRAFRNLGGMQFADVTKEWGLEGTTRNDGIVLADLDDDGDLDLYVANVEGRNRLYRNTLDDPRWLKVRLGVARRDGIGAMVRLLTSVVEGKGKGILATVPIPGGFGFCSQGPPEASFRLPGRGNFDVEVVFPGNRPVRLRGVRPGTIDATVTGEAVKP